jgi:recombination protein RecT
MSDIEIQTKTGISVIERVDSSPARTAKTALARLETVMDRFQDIETDRMPSKTFLSLATVAMMKNSKLLQCNFASVLQCLLQCHAWGLDPTGKNNGAFLIAYRDECQLQLGYGALIDLATRDGTVTDIDAQIVYDHDKFEVEMGTNPSIIHEPDFKASRRGRGDGVAYYAVATFAAGHKKFVVLTRPEV